MIGRAALAGRGVGLHDLAPGRQRRDRLPFAHIIGTTAALVLGMITAVSALRVRGVSLAVVTLVWGEEDGGSGKPTVERHVQTELRAIVAPVPYVESVRRAYAPESWRATPSTSSR
jgi:hypothetical protein